MNHLADIDIQPNAQGTEYHWTIERDVLLEGLKTISGVVESSQVLQILSHVHMTLHESHLQLIASDSEVELRTRIQLAQPIQTTCSLSVSCRKLMDVCRTLPQGSILVFKLTEGWLSVESGQAQFKLATLPADRFPILTLGEADASITVSEARLHQTIQKTYFAMAHQDVRFFLNGLHIKLNADALCATATDGHRLARLSSGPVATASDLTEIIMPRKAVLELMRLLSESETQAQVLVSKHHIQISTEQFVLTSNLLEGDYPKCDALLDLPEAAHIAIVECAAFKQVLSRAAILSHEKFKGARLFFENNQLEVSANNADQESSKDAFEIQYSGAPLKLAFNIHYVLDVLNVIKTDQMQIHLTNSQNSVLLTEAETEGECAAARYLIMPLTL